MIGCHASRPQRRRGRFFGVRTHSPPRFPVSLPLFDWWNCAEILNQWSLDDETEWSWFILFRKDTRKVFDINMADVRHDSSQESVPIRRHEDNDKAYPSVKDCSLNFLIKAISLRALSAAVRFQHSNYGRQKKSLSNKNVDFAQVMFSPFA